MDDEVLDFVEIDRGVPLRFRRDDLEELRTGADAAVERLDAIAVGGEALGQAAEDVLGVLVLKRLSL